MSVILMDAMLWGEHSRWASGVSGKETRRHVQGGTRRYFSDSRTRRTNQKLIVFGRFSPRLRGRFKFIAIGLRERRSCSKSGAYTTCPTNTNFPGHDRNKLHLQMIFNAQPLHSGHGVTPLHDAQSLLQKSSALLGKIDHHGATTSM